MEFAKIWPLTCHNWVKYWPRTKNNTTNREYSARAICWSFPRSSTTLRLETPRGGRTNPPLHWRRWWNTVYGRRLISYEFMSFIFHLASKFCHYIFIPTPNWKVIIEHWLSKWFLTARLYYYFLLSHQASTWCPILRFTLYGMQLIRL